MADDESKVAEIVHKIQVYVYPRRIRLREFFLDFDKLKSGRVTRVQFGRALDDANVKLSEDEVELLIEYFTQTGPNVQKPQIVNYKKCCDEVDEVFAADEAEMSPSGAMREAMSPNSTLRQSIISFTPNEVEDEERMMHLLHRVSTMCQNRGVIFKYCYQDCDRGPSPSPSMVCPRRSGKVNPGQFKRLFPFKDGFTDEDLNLLVQRYITDNGDVHYLGLHNDISEVLDPKPPPFPRSDLILRPDDTEWDHSLLNPVKKIQSKVVEKRVRLTEIFKDFDALRKGFCTPGQLKTALTILNLDKEVNRDDYSHLVETYTREDGMFCYAAFCKDVDMAFSVPGLEKEPLASITMPDAATTSPARRNRMTMTSSRQSKIVELEEKIRARVKKRRILMTPTFKDMDKAAQCHVTRSQFTRVMGMLGFELEPTEIALLCSVYCDLGNHNDFNYYDFIKSVDPPDEEQEIAMQQASSPYQDMSPSKYFDTCGQRVRALDRQSPIMC